MHIIIHICLRNDVNDKDQTRTNLQTLKLQFVTSNVNLNWDLSPHGKYTLERGRHRPDLHAGSASELPENHLHVIEGFANYKKHHDVGDQEGAAAVLVGRVRESPDVPEADRERYAGHEELQPVSPLRSRFLLLLLDRQRDLRSKLPGVSKALAKEIPINVAYRFLLNLLYSRTHFRPLTTVRTAWIYREFRRRRWHNSTKLIIC